MTVRGDVDLATAPQFQSAMLAAIKANQPQVLELDMSELQFLDARGISALLHVCLTGRDVGCRVRLVRPNAHIRRVLEITGVPALCELVN